MDDGKDCKRNRDYSDNEFIYGANYTFHDEWPALPSSLIATSQIILKTEDYLKATPPPHYQKHLDDYHTWRS
jgi:hypothetical protein